MKCLVAMDSFKGSLTAKEACDAVEQGIKKNDEHIVVYNCPIADGGEGTIDALIANEKGRKIHLKLHDPLSRITSAYYGILDDGTAIIEMAKASGLTLLNDQERNPLNTTTFGVGEMIKDALDKGIREFIIGIGGSATNDAGIGMLQALGMKFYDKDNLELSPIGKSLNYIERIDLSDFDKRIKNCKFLIASDVNNPLFGINGAAFIYGPQKGADKEIVKTLDEGLKNFHEHTKKIIGYDYHLTPGAGAAGGLGYAFQCFFDAELKPGIDIVFEKLKIENILKNVDLIITGEGRIDKQSAMGKVLYGIGKLGIKYRIPVIALGGSVDNNLSLEQIGITSTFSLTKEPMTLKEAMDKEGTKMRLENIAMEIIKKER